MALASGTRFGSYEITGQLGAGGMGEVYRATDTSLKRAVAVKILPPAFADDGDRVARFQREAESLAALNHLNIAQVYGLEKSGGATAIVMELVDGPTLAERIAQGPIPVDEALSIARQVADALAAAHGRGIVHRDLKPANVKLKPDGTVKVLDFGIATAPESPIATSGRRSPALLTPALTEAGILLGTAAYMSPEQARGKPVDERADIWAFGCVLYEMLGGQPAFGGEDVTTTLARVLEREAKLDSLPADVSPHVRHTIKLCLEKDPSKRIADIRDVRLALEGRFESDSRVAAAQGKADRSRGRGALLLAAGLVAGAVIVGAAGFALWPGPAPQPITRLAMSVAPGANPFLQVSISRDGSRIGFRAGNPAQIFVRRLDEFEARPVSGAQAGTAPWPPCFSPDGTSLAYSVLGGEIKKVPLAGGAALTVAEGLDTPDWCDWADDGYIYFGVNAGIMRVAESGGETEMVAAFDAASGEVSAELPQLLPGGRQLLFTVLGSDGLANPDLAVLNLETRERSALIRGAGYATYAPTGPGATQGHLVYGRSGALFAAPFDLSTLEAGPASPVLEGIRATGPTSFVGVSDTGTLAYLVGASTAIGTLLQWVDRTGAAGPLPEGVHAYGSVALSPDGQRAAVDIFDFETLTVDLWVYELDGDRLTRLTFGGLNGPAVWTPDGQRLVYWHAETISATAGELRVVPGDNSAPPATLVAVQEAAAIPTSISFDGTVLIGTRNRGANNSDIWALSLDASTATDAASPAIDDVLGTNFNEREARLSPDGRHIAYTSNESGRDEIYVVPYPGPGGKTQVSTAGGRLPRWNPNGRELFYVSGTSLMAVDVETAPVFRRLTPKVLFEAPQLASTNADSYDIAPDGSRFLMEAIPESAEGEQVDIRIVVNWFEELRKLAPWPERDQ